MDSQTLEALTAVVGQYGIFGFSALLVVQVLVSFARAMGLPSQFAPLAAVLFGVLIGEGVAYYNGMDYLHGATIGIMLAAVAGFSYDAGQLKEVFAKWLTGTSVNAAVKDETGGAGLFMAQILAACAFVALAYLFIGLNSLLITVIALAVILGYVVGLRARFRHSNSLEKQVIKNRLRDIARA